MSGLAHLFGDYVAQSDWMATRKTSEHGPAAAHALTYTACFLPVTRNPKALAKPAWMSVWLMIAADNTLHLAVNRWALRRWR